jgi:hypothetical protein
VLVRFGSVGSLPLFVFHHVVGLFVAGVLGRPLPIRLPACLLCVSPPPPAPWTIAIQQAIMMDLLGGSSVGDFVSQHPLFVAIGSVFVAWQLWRLVSSALGPKNLPPIEHGWLPWFGVALTFAKNPVDYATQMLKKVCAGDCSSSVQPNALLRDTIRCMAVRERLKLRECASPFDLSAKARRYRP